MIRYDRLWATMEAQGMTQYRLIKHYNFSAGQIGRLKKNMHVSTHTLDTLCTLLGCDISDIIEYIPEGSPAPEEPSVPEAGSAEKETSSKSRKSDSPKGDKPKKSEPKKSAKSKKGDKKAAIDTLGPDRILFGSDTPFYDAADVIREYDRMLSGYDEEVRRKIMGENAGRLFGLPVQSV